MKLTGNFAKKIYVILILVLFVGLLLPLTHSKFFLNFQQNQSLLEEKKEFFKNGFADKKPIDTGNAYCVFYDRSDNYSSKLKGNAIKSLAYMQKKTIEIPVGEESEDLTKCKVAILATDEIGHLGSVEEVERYVQEGGYILFMSVLEADKAYRMLSSKLGVSSFYNYIVTKGIHLTSNVLIGEEDLTIDEKFISNTSLNVILAEGTELLAKSYHDEPLLWRSDYGRGAFMSFNGTFLQEKMNRGLFVGALSLLEPNFIYPIFNLKVFFIDNFPSPIRKGTTQVIYDEYKKDIPSFYQEIWWPDMLKTARDYQLKYTGATIETYNDRVEQPFGNIDDKPTNYLITYGRELLESGGEIGFQGYNDQPLVMEKEFSNMYGYKKWISKLDMSKSVEELASFTKNAFPQYTVTSYIPPSNILSAEGREILKKTWKDMTVISSLYTPDEQGVAYVQEFEVAKDGIIEMPRITSGFSEQGNERWAEANAMTGIGVFSHFVHPNDVISEEGSSNLGWGKTHELFNAYMSRVQQTYPWVRALPATQAALDMAKSIYSHVTWSQSNSSIEGHVANYRSETSYVLRTTKNIESQTNCTVVEIDENTYLVTAKAANFKIELGEPELENLSNS